MPDRGVYFFFESGERRLDSGDGSRVVRVGTHGLKLGSKSTLQDRLAQHRGRARSAGGNHRGSVFRHLIGEAMIARGDVRACLTWGIGSSATRTVREGEEEIEAAVSRAIATMSVIWINIADPAGPDSIRGHIERNAIALLSNWNKPVRDAPSPNWLGYQSLHPRVRWSGLWNNNHVDEAYDPSFLDSMEKLL